MNVKITRKTCLDSWSNTTCSGDVQMNDDLDTFVRESLEYIQNDKYYHEAY